MAKELLHIVDRVVLSSELDKLKKKDEGYGFDASFIVDDNAASSGISFSDIGVDTDIPKRRGRPPKKENAMVKAAEIYRTENANNPINSNMSYEDTYKPTVQVLTNTVGQIDMMSNRIMQDLDMVRNLRDKRKWEFVSMLSGTATGLIGNKISALREINSTISKAHDLELRRAKELKFGVDDGNDDKKIMDLYNAYINTPIGTVAGASPIPYAGVSQADITAAGMMGGGMPINSEQQIVPQDPGYNAYMNSLSPEQNAMFYEDNPYIETIVVYDNETQEKHFEVIDNRTGQMVPNVPVPTQTVLDGVVVDIRRGMARNAQINQNYKLRVIGQRAMNEY